MNLVLLPPLGPDYLVTPAPPHPTLITTPNMTAVRVTSVAERTKQTVDRAVIPPGDVSVLPAAHTLVKKVDRVECVVALSWKNVSTDFVDVLESQLLVVQFCIAI